MLPLNLNGNNLGKRHRQLNEKVTEVLSTKFNFDDIKLLPEESDIDRLFKIDLASKIQNIDYILDTLKSGDELYISKALKCLWIYNDKHADIINNDFLHDNVFPFMSERMIRKTLTTIANNLNSQTRAYNFYTYCIQNKRNELAKKFLSQTSTEFKLSLITDKDQNMRYGIGTWVHVIGDSFSLAEAYLQSVSNPDSYIFNKFRHLYSLSNTQYLDLFEQYSNINSYSQNIRLGLRMSKDIILKHKDRVLRKPKLYVYFLDWKMLVKHLSIDDIKTILDVLMPPKVECFWNETYYAKHKLLIEALPLEERFIYIKSTYQKKYPDVEFEMRNNFYHQNLFELMTVQQKEEWALRQLKSNNEVFGTKCNYKWYNFIDFKITFAELKKLIYKTTDEYHRLAMLTILIKRAKEPNEIKSLLTYLFERHINEQSKERFIQEIQDSHNVFEFDETCWNTFNKLLHSIEVYNTNISRYSLQDARLTVLLYHILHNIPLPPDVFDCFIFGVIDLLSCRSSFHTMLTESIPPAKHEVVFEVLSKAIIERLEQYDNENFDVEKIKSVIYLYCNLNRIFKKKDYPDIIINLAKKDENFSFILEDEKIEHLTQKKLIRLLKTDTSLLDARIPEAVKESENRIRFDKLNRKLKIYFYKDSAKLWLKSFMENLDNENERAIKTAIFFVFQLADKSQKKEIMLKYAPTNPIIEHGKIDRHLLYIQEAICRFSMYSRPPVPLDLTLLYLKGDYVHYCLPMFNFYAVSLPCPESTKFIQSLLDAPVSIQKHGIRLLFKHSSFDKQESLVKGLWKKSKNVSLRSIMFCSVFNAICNEKSESKQLQILDLLKTLMLDLNEDDDEEVFKKIVLPKLPNNVIGQFSEYAYSLLHKMPDNSYFWTFRTDILKTVKGHIDHMREAFLENLIEEFINEMSLIEELKTDGEKSYINMKWKLVVKYLISSKNEDNSLNKLIILKKIIDHCFVNWDTLKDEWYVSRKFFEEFLDWLKEEAFHDISCHNNYVTISPLFELILKEIEYKFSIHDMYVIKWDLNFMILFVNITDTVKTMKNLLDKKLKFKELAQLFGKGVYSLLNKFIEKDMYFACMLPEIVHLLEGYIDQCVNVLNEWDHSNDFSVLVMSSLLNVDNVASCLIALHVLSSEIPADSYVKLEYASLVKKLESSNDGGVKTKYCQMFHALKNRFV